MANISFVHARDHAAVLFVGELDWEAAHELVSTIETVVDTYFYTQVELIIVSQGGNVRAFDYYLGAFRAWQRDGVHFRTRVISTVGSAAALMVSLGDERVAEPGATLTYHYARFSGASDITANATAELQTALRDVDERIIARLADRALADPRDADPAPFESERWDRETLERLHAGLNGRDRSNPPSKRRRLAKAVGRAVDRAFRNRDRDALTRLYGRLFEIESPVSAKLARTLRLLDRIATRGAEPRRTLATPGLCIPEWRVLYPPKGEVPRELLTRHTLVLGETGAGKTASCMLPVVAALATTPPQDLGSALVIDPKLELGPVLARLAPERLHHVTAERSVVNLMASPHWSLDEDLAAGRWHTAALKILVRVASFVRSSAARVLMNHAPGNDNTEFFCREGTSLASTVIAFVLMVTSPDAPPAEHWLDDDVEAWLFLEELLERARGTPRERGSNVLALAAWALEGPLLAALDDAGIVVSAGTATTRATWLFARIAKALLAHRGEHPREGRDVLRRIVEYWEPIARTRGQYAGGRATASTICADFATHAIATTLYFGCEPGYLADTNDVDFAHLVSRDAPGTLVLFQPARDGLDNLIAISLKAAFFEAVLDDPDRAQGARTMRAGWRPRPPRMRLTSSTESPAGACATSPPVT